jgi:hypothetical protein
VVIRVHGFTGPQVHRCIKCWSSVSRSTSEIKWVKGYSPLVIVAAGDGTDGSELIPLQEWRLRTEHGEVGAISPELGWGSALVG